MRSSSVLLRVVCSSCFDWGVAAHNPESTGLGFGKFMFSWSVRGVAARLLVRCRPL